MGNFDSRFDSKLIDRWRVLLDDGVQPAVLARVCRWGRAHSDDLATEILRLAHAGVIRVHRGERYDRLRGCDIADYRLSRDPSASACADPVDATTLKMLFDVIAGGADELWMGEFHRYARSHAGDFRTAMLSWDAELDDAVKCSGAFVSATVSLQKALPFVAGACLLGGFLALLGTGSPVYLAALAVVAAALFAVSRQMPRLSPLAQSRYDAAFALRSWLRELPAQGRGARIPDDQAFWSKFMPVAFLLGEADSVLATLKVAAPEVIDDAREGVCANAGASVGDLRELAWPEWYEGPEARRADETAPPALSALLLECIADASFAANATASTEALQALNSPVNAVLTIGGIPGVGGMSNAPQSSSELFIRHPKKPKKR